MHGGGGGMAACGCTLTSHVRMWARAAALTCAVRRCRARSAQRCKTETPAAAEAAGALASAAAWCFGAGSSLGAEAGRFLLSSSHFSFILAASDPFWFHQMLALRPASLTEASSPRACSSFTTSDLSVADTEAVPQAGSNGTLHRFIATGVALGGVERDGELASHEQLLILEVAWRCRLWPYRKPGGRGVAVDRRNRVELDLVHPSGLSPLQSAPPQDSATSLQAQTRPTLRAESSDTRPA